MVYNYYWERIVFGRKNARGHGRMDDRVNRVGKLVSSSMLLTRHYKLHRELHLFLTLIYCSFQDKYDVCLD